MLIVLAGISLAIAAAFLVEAATVGTRRRRSALLSVPSYAGPAFPVSRSRRARLGAPRPSSLLGRLTLTLANLTLKATGSKSVDAVRAKLTAAGLADRISTTTFLASKAALAAGGVVVGAAIGGALEGPGRSIALALVLGAVGFIMPDFIVGRRATVRREQIRADLPNAFDVLSICVEAGLSLDGAIQTLTSRLRGPLADEFTIVRRELEIGESRREALKKLAERVDLPEMTSFTSAVIQGDRLGISLSSILRTVASDARRRRQAHAEEQANKLTVKLIFPTVFFILPAIFVVAIGPAIIDLVRAL